ncbi:MAG: pilus assembly protein PilP [Deltaproteobacteria bacterium]|nr:pilus assembly protein PilP [Deltaproteobacteria bacterium]
MSEMKKFLFIYVLLGLLLFPAWGGTQEEKESPSQKTKEAIEKFKKAPATAGQTLDALKEAAKAKLQEALGGKQAAKVETGSTTLPAKKPEQPERPRYSSVGKRDPFRPLSLKPKASQRARENLSPLERYELGQLKLVAIVWDIKEPKAMVEDGTSLGYIVKIGTLIGPNEGKVKAIKPTEVIIEERFTDFYGARKSQEVSMKLPVE